MNKERILEIENSAAKQKITLISIVNYMVLIQAASTTVNLITKLKSKRLLKVKSVKLSQLITKAKSKEIKFALNGIL